jgi:hypothetical protein
MDSNTNDHDPEGPPDVPPDELQEALQWLEELTGPSTVGTTADEAVDSPFHGLVDDGGSDLPDWLREAPKESVEPRLADEGEFESRLDWLAKMAERESIEELPTLEWRNLSDAPQPPADAEGAPPADDTLPPIFPPELLPVEAPPEPLTAEALLLVPDALADEVLPAAAPEAEAPAAPLVNEEAVVALETTPITPEALLDTLPPDEELPPIDDLDAAMAWIEELAASQDAPIEDVPSVADRALASKLLMEAGLSSDGLDLRPGDELALGDLSLLEGNTPVNAFVAAEDFADTIVLVETMAADQGRPLPPDYPAFEPPAAAEVSFDEAMAFLDELAADQEPLGAQTQPLEPVEVVTGTVLFVTDELQPAEALLSEPSAAPPPWLADDAEPAVAQAAGGVDLTEPETYEPVEGAATEAADAVLAGEWSADAVDADVAPAPDDVPWLAGSEEESKGVTVEPEARFVAPSGAAPVVAAALPPLAAELVVTGNGDIAASLEETLRALDALALPPGQTLAEFDTALQQYGATAARRDLPAAVEWLELALGISVATTPPVAQWSDDELITQMPDDPDAVLAWLEQLAEEDTVDSSPQLSAAEPPPGTTLGTPTVSASQQAAGSAAPLIDELSEADLQNMPEDPDAVMAWLEGLAGSRSEPVTAVPATAPVLPEAPLPPALPAPDQASPVSPSRSRRRRGRKSPPPVAPVEALSEPSAGDAFGEPAGQSTTDAAASALVLATMTPDAPPEEWVEAPAWDQTADAAAPDVTGEIAEPVESRGFVGSALTVAEHVAADVEVGLDEPAAPSVEEALSAPEATAEPPVEVATPLPLPARPRRRGRPPKVAPVDVAAETTGATVEEATGPVDAAGEPADDTAEAQPQPPQEIEPAPPPAKPASWVDLLKPLK